MTESESTGHLHPCRYTADEIFEFIKERSDHSKKTNALTRWKDSTATDGEVKS